MKKKNIFLLLSIVVPAMILMLASCKKEKETKPSEEVENSPDLPPSSSMEMSYETFPKTNKMADTDTADTAGYKNIVFASGNVVVWSMLVGATMVIPVAAFREAFKHKPVRVERKHWKWSYDVPVGFVKYTAELHGRISTDSIRWEMYLSKSNDFLNQKWFYGSSDLKLNAGTWTLYYRDTAKNFNPFIYIEWHRNLSLGTADIKYTNIMPKDSGNGGYIQYGFTNSTPYNAFYDIYFKQKNNLTSIKWHTVNIEGRVKDALYFKDDSWHCWDKTKKNMTCPN